MGAYQALQRSARLRRSARVAQASPRQAAKVTVLKELVDDLITVLRLGKPMDEAFGYHNTAGY